MELHQIILNTSLKQMQLVFLRKAGRAVGADHGCLTMLIAVVVAADGTVAVVAVVVVLVVVSAHGVQMADVMVGEELLLGMATGKGICRQMSY